jgi:hypothetical protein
MDDRVSGSLLTWYRVCWGVLSWTRQAKREQCSGKGQNELGVEWKLDRRDRKSWLKPETRPEHLRCNLHMGQVRYHSFKARLSALALVTVEVACATLSEQITAKQLQLRTDGNQATSPLCRSKNLQSITGDSEREGERAGGTHERHTQKGVV